MDRIYYVFWDYDDETDKDLDIDGEAYTELIDVCFRYAEVFAVTYSLKGFHEVQHMGGSVFQYCVAKKAILNGQIRCYFKCCQATKQYLLETDPCLFSWYWNEKQHGYLPENLTFIAATVLSFSLQKHTRVSAFYIRERRRTFPPF